MADAPEKLTRDERAARIVEINERTREIFEMHEDTDWPDAARAEWNDLHAEKDSHERIIEENDKARAVMAQASERSFDKPEFQTNRPGAKARDKYDLDAIRRDAANGDDEVRMLRDSALRAVEESVKKGGPQQHIESIIERDQNPGSISRHILMTGSPVYRSAFRKKMTDGFLSAAEADAMQTAMRAMSDSSTGVPLPFVLDPTVILTSNGVANPIRQIARNEVIAGTNQWKTATSGSVTAAYATEAQEASDNSPTLTQPSATVLRAQAFVPLSFELDADWAGVEAELAREISDGKDVLEATKFYSGTGTVEPQGITSLSTSYRVRTASTATFAYGDVYSTQNTLPPRWQTNAQWVGSLTQINRVRQFDTAGGAQAFTPNINVGQPDDLLGRPIHQLSTAGTSIASGSKILYYGDWSNYIVIDRVGMTVDVIPHLFGTANNYPTGQKGVFAYWRNYAMVLNAQGFQFLEAL